MKKIVPTKHAIRPYIIVAILFAMYVAAFAILQAEMGIEIASLAVVPVITASWYFGIRGGIFIAFLGFLANSLILAATGYNFGELLEKPGNVIGGLSLLVTAILFGMLSRISRERKDALIKLKEYEKQRDLHATFLEKLDRITSLVLEPDNLQATLEILTEQLAILFQAQDGFFALWDAERELSIPTAAFGSMKETYPSIRFEPGEVTLATSAMKAEHAVPVVDINDTPYLSPRVASFFPSQSMLGIPFITQRYKLGALLLGYEGRHVFTPDELYQAQITSEQVAPLLSKLQMLEEERKRVRQLTALHDVAQISIQVDNEDQLIEQATCIIGNNLFPDNFGIMLLDEKEEYLYPHLSYRFYRTEKLLFSEIPLGKGITGQVAKSGQSQRIGNVREIEQYLDMDENTVSELCVPIRFKERILGVINAESTRWEAFSEEDERLLVTLAGQLATAMEQMRKGETERKWFDQLAHSRDLIYSIAHITTLIDRSLREDEITQALDKELEKIGITCIMAAYDSSLKSFTINYTSLQPQLLNIVETGLGYPLVDYIFPGNRLDVFLTKEELSQPAVILDTEREICAIFTQINQKGVPRILREIGVDHIIKPMRLPLVFEENLLGMLWVWGPGITHSDLPILSIFAKQISNSLERARLFEEIQSLALTDPLTGLQNRRSVFELGRMEFSRAWRMKRPFCCMMLDIDHFKKINDNFGHQIGDQVLQEIANLCQDSVREGDLVGRYGGEELIILMPETDREMAVRVAERLKSRMAEKSFTHHTGEFQVTVSIGVASQDENTPHLEALIARADQALYISKHKGRNQVAVSV